MKSRSRCQLVRERGGELTTARLRPPRRDDKLIGAGLDNLIQPGFTGNLDFDDTEAGMRSQRFSDSPRPVEQSSMMGDGHAHRRAGARPDGSPMNSARPVTEQFSTGIKWTLSIQVVAGRAQRRKGRPRARCWCRSGIFRQRQCDSLFGEFLAVSGVGNVPRHHRDWHRNRPQQHGGAVLSCQHAVESRARQHASVAWS